LALSGGGSPVSFDLQGVGLSGGEFFHGSFPFLLLSYTGHAPL
jgi:hypothetical protein